MFVQSSHMIIQPEYSTTLPTSRYLQLSIDLFFTRSDFDRDWETRESWIVTYDSENGHCICKTDTVPQSTMGPTVKESKEWKDWENMVRKSGNTGRVDLYAGVYANALEGVFKVDAKERLEKGGL
ncbi:hypothetical protein L486_05293 [Kwoniella mangroviensis CBS 10435]|uniref:Uncharacterized protein n=1 Tax=Kwoniella mangroviensis CBS 10435 TaxID=1331196 RepID=A0A1B9IQK7_9TREE|nr:uncharacterized protein I203_08490 [Kwoniella mangroviensis CBS 8507]OCF57828.1 hypothetical protein L486_05293 [Kwoniella mangroviensis CBS 10435]OCF62437.1 hypothetical protein I203_08490 [Kwoniella mangroviensis CBS 8507]